MGKSVNMWDGENTGVTLKTHNGCRHDVMLKFEENIRIRDDREDRFIVNVKVANS